MAQNSYYAGNSISPVWGINIGTDATISWGGNTANIATGNAGEVLTSQGPNSSPVWSDLLRSVAGDDGIAVTVTDGNANVSWVESPAGAAWDSAANISIGDVFIGRADQYVYLAPGSTVDNPIVSNVTSWAQRSTGPQVNLNDITGYLNNRFIVGDEGLVLVSTNGFTWQQQAAPTLNKLTSIATDGTNYIMVGEGGVAVRVTVGEWQYRLSNTGVTLNLNSIAYGDGAFQAVGDLGTVLISQDAGVSWLPQNSRLNQDLITISSSATGTSWLLAGVRGTVLTADQNGWVYTNNRDAVNWSQFTNLNGGTYVNGTYVLAGSSSTVNYSILYSQDGIFWSQAPGAYPGNTVVYNSAASSGSIAVLVANGGRIATSPDGVNWTAQDSKASSDLLGARYINGRWYALGSLGALRVSDDSVEWTAVNTGVFTRLRDIASNADGTVWLIVGEVGRVMRNTTDGPGWSDVTGVSTGAIASCIYFNNHFLIVDSFGVIRRSSDGTSWNTVTTFPGISLLRLEKSDTYVLVSGTAGFIASSVDGITWNRQRTNQTRNLPALLFNGSDLWVAAGGAGSANSQVIIYNDNNGNAWQFDNRTNELSTSVDILGSAISSDSRLHLAGTGGSVFQSSNYGFNWTASILDPGVDFLGLSRGRNYSYSTLYESIVAAASDGSVWVLNTAGAVGAPWYQRRPEVISVPLRKAYLDVYRSQGLVSNGDYPASYPYRWFVVGNQGVVLYDPVGSSTNSTQITSLVGRTTGPTVTFNKIRYFNGTWFLIGPQGTLMYSFNSVDWILVSVPLSVTTGQVFDLFDMANGKGLYVITCSNGGIIYSTGDPSSWDTFPEITDSAITALLFDGSTFYAGCENGRFLSSVDGLNWNDLGIRLSRLVTSMRYFDGIYIVTYSVISRSASNIYNTNQIYSGISSATYFGSAIYSTDFSNWIQLPYNESGYYYLYSVRSSTWTAETGYTIVGDYGYVLRSTNARDWSLTRPWTSPTIDIIPAHDKLIAINYDGTIYTSVDGDVWRRSSSTSLYGLTSAATDGEKVIFVGASGVFMTDGNGTNIISLNVLNNNQFSLAPEGRYRVLGSVGNHSDYAFWTRIG